MSTKPLTLKKRIVRVKKPQAIVLDISGTIAKKAFMAYSEESKAFVKNNVEKYIKETINTSKSLRLDFNFMKLQETIDKKSVETVGAPKLAEQNTPRREKYESIIPWVVYKVDHGLDCPSMALFQLYMVEWGYQKGIVKTPLYDEVLEVFKKWKEEGILIYVSLGSVAFINLIFGMTTAGDVGKFIDGHINLMEWRKDKLSKNFELLAPSLQIPEEAILYLTRIAFDAHHARSNKIRSILVMRPDFDPELNEKMELRGEFKKQNLLKSDMGKGQNSQISEIREVAIIARETQTESNNTKTLEIGSSDRDNLLKVQQDSSNVDSEQNISLEELSSIESLTGSLTGSKEEAVTSQITLKDITDFPCVHFLDEIEFTAP